MRNLVLSTLLVLIAIFSAGCASAPFDPSLPVEKNDSIFRERAYAQSGTVINIADLREKLEELPECRDSALSSAHWKIAGQASALATLGLAFGSLAATDSTQTWLLVSALPTLIFEFIAFHISDEDLHDAVLQFDQQVVGKTKKPAHASLAPYLTATPDGKVLGGLSLAW
jgi:hypothetical protein